MASVHSIYNSFLCSLFHSQLTQHFLCTLVCSSGTKAFLKFPRESERDMKRESLECVYSLAFSSLFTFFSIYVQKDKNLFYVFHPLNFLKST